MVVRRIV